MYLADTNLLLTIAGIDGLVKEVHIEVESAKVSNKYIEFFISENELHKFKNDERHRIYYLFKVGRNYKLHEVNKTNFFNNNYLTRHIE